ncbi:TadE family protein [Microbacterium sp. NIBRBAC000506063]|uniref:TadE family protein n=1 Tax=Microbacterium sp. NIBRBAC000506063 TaxID=2734618 RepID=UPI001CB6C9F4|nr:TadE family protein [Microbacterium sp. NIBRBAC000506063]
MRRPRVLAEERGSSTVDFVLVGTLLTALTLGVLQLGFVVYVRNIVHDAAVEGAHHAALADTTLADGAERAGLVITRAIGAQYAEDVTARASTALGHPTVEIRVRTTLPLLGLLGVPGALEVSAHAPQESFDD